jgi:hypothetical protein
MALVTHPATGFALGDPDSIPLARGKLPSPADMAAAAAPLILSSAGWRKVFAARDDGSSGGGEESRTERVSAADLVLAGAATIAFGEELRARSGKAAPAVIVGIDSRPTGPALADAMIRAFLGMGLGVHYLFIAAAPEIMAYAARAVALPEGHEERASATSRRATIPWGTTASSSA